MEVAALLLALALGEPRAYLPRQEKAPVESVRPGDLVVTPRRDRASPDRLAVTNVSHGEGHVTFLGYWNGDRTRFEAVYYADTDVVLVLRGGGR